MIMSRLWRATVLLALLSCKGDLIDGGLTPAEQVTVDRYLACIDCVVDLDSVRALGGRKSDATVDSLNKGLLYGPSTPLRTAADSVLKIGYTRDSLWRFQKGLPPLPQRVIYIDAALQRYINGYRARGATGMGYIGTTRARVHLDSALNLPLPPSVMAAVKYARDSLPPP